MRADWRLGLHRRQSQPGYQNLWQGSPRLRKGPNPLNTGPGRPPERPQNLAMRVYPHIRSKRTIPIDMGGVFHAALLLPGTPKSLK